MTDQGVLTRHGPLVLLSESGQRCTGSFFQHSMRLRSYLVSKDHPSLGCHKRPYLAALGSRDESETTTFLVARRDLCPSIVGERFRPQFKITKLSYTV